MKLKDARHLSSSAQEALRYRVVNAVENGMSKSEASRVFKVSLGNTPLDESYSSRRLKGIKSQKARTTL